MLTGIYSTCAFNQGISTAGTLSFVTSSKACAPGVPCSRVTKPTRGWNNASASRFSACLGKDTSRIGESEGLRAEAAATSIGTDALSSGGSVCLQTKTAATFFAGLELLSASEANDVGKVHLARCWRWHTVLLKPTEIWLSISGIGGTDGVVVFAVVVSIARFRRLDRFPFDRSAYCRRWSPNGLSKLHNNSRITCSPAVSIGGLQEGCQLPLYL
jgi:hypothetical protein